MICGASKATAPSLSQPGLIYLIDLICPFHYLFMENNNFVSGLRQPPVAVVTVSGCDKAHVVSLRRGNNKKTKKTGRWELMNEASATHISCTLRGAKDACNLLQVLLGWKRSRKRSCCCRSGSMTPAVFGFHNRWALVLSV